MRRSWRGVPLGGTIPTSRGHTMGSRSRRRRTYGDSEGSAILVRETSRSKLGKEGRAWACHQPRPSLYGFPSWLDPDPDLPWSVEM
ncbi:hypothetical protein BDZ89DRAFT_1072041 [Hymenopellis radicata]|nr:hypothetical protein BDZ89DRAFT_1072041 [Hymenopellis radicata]